ncbi:mitochondrial FAD-linked sulfhydryl oxidase-like protein ERV1 [Trichodelitschia bisporula]|uniref:Sulfhydryl oxidase n=1 Tax=Trichodelitschia bisporula TaxID=703511 RepID=A0A6G1I2M8_9PEZI|nr:mitochondrial FAD-linked sulfhydryl oxidase-like protein ERV1 [Trichodelitschia bisporula]
MSTQPSNPPGGLPSNPTKDYAPKKLPKGVVLGPDGKPCRSCTSFASWAAMTKKQTSNSTSTSTTSSTTQLQPPPDCPPDVEQLGRSSWTLLHSIAATYPEKPNPTQQQDARQFISSFSRLYPCHWCATDFQKWMKSAEHAPRVSSRSEFGQWLCEAHNEVNAKLGKDLFDCTRWEERWCTGWKDGRCD